MSITEPQNMLVETTKFFNLLYGKIPANNFSYLIKFAGGNGIYSFAISDETQRELMAHKAIELSNKGVDVWQVVNPVCIERLALSMGCRGRI